MNSKLINPSKDPLVDDFYAKDIIPLIKKYRGDSPEEPLDGDAVDMLVKRLKDLINLHEGNITENEYWEMMI